MRADGRSQIFKYLPLTYGEAERGVSAGREVRVSLQDVWACVIRPRSAIKNCCDSRLKGEEKGQISSNSYFYSFASFFPFLFLSTRPFFSVSTPAGRPPSTFSITCASFSPPSWFLAPALQSVSLSSSSPDIFFFAASLLSC